MLRLLGNGSNVLNPSLQKAASEPLGAGLWEAMPESILTVSIDEYRILVP
jgi:hypothetical protein